MAALSTIEGIGPALSEKLHDAGVRSIKALLEAGSSKAGRAKLTDATGIDHKRILRFVNHADLMRVKGIGGEYAELLEASGVDTVPELARRNAENLHQKMKATNEEKALVRSLASMTTVQGWIDQAKDLPKAVTH